MGVISREDPLITAKPTPAASSKARRQTAGNAVGSPLPVLDRYGPVTTDPLLWERLQSLSHPLRMVEDVPNPWLGQNAGSLQQAVDVPSYLSGYVDGEGCFMVSIAPRNTLKVGWEVRPSVSVSQNGDRPEVLLLLQEYFRAGTLRPDRSDKTLKWEVRSLSVLITKVIPHFERYPLLSGKQKDFELFAEICRRMMKGEHLVAGGLEGIIRLTRSMNPSGKRRYVARNILIALAEMKA